jgi:hypothetical protein
MPIGRQGRLQTSGCCAERPLLEDVPPFLPAPAPFLETLPSLFHIYFSDRLLGPKSRRIRTL